MGAAAFAAEKTPSGMIEKYSDDNGGSVIAGNYLGALETARDGVLRHESEVDLSKYRIKVADISAFVNTLRSCYAETFGLDTSFSFTYMTSGGVDYIYSLFPYYTVSAAENKKMLAEFYAKADGYLALVDDSMNDFTKALIIHDAIVMNCEYIITKDGVEATPYTLMVEGWGKCEDYSRAYAYLLAQLGIKSEIISSNPMNHEWMKIKLEGKYYQVDLTWDDSVSSNEGTDLPGRVSHDYFLYSNSSFPNHYGYYEVNTSADATYDDYYIHNMGAQLCMVNSTLYGIYCAPGEVETKLVSYNAKNELTTVYDLGAAAQSVGGFWASHWSAGGGSYYASSYANLCSYDGLLYYNMPKAVYVFDPARGINLKLADYKGGNQLYGLKITGGKLYGNDSSSPLSSGTLAEVADCLQMGDVENDGILNVIDATKLQRRVAEMLSFDSFGELKADFNHDGAVNISDATAIQYAIAQ